MVPIEYAFTPIHVYIIYIDKVLYYSLLSGFEGIFSLSIEISLGMRSHSMIQLISQLLGTVLKYV